MNLVIKNQNYKIIDSLSIDVIKTLEGEFSKEDLEKELINFIFNKAIIDITSIKNYFDASAVLNFLSFFDTSKVIILLNNSELVNSSGYLSILIEHGYYNFTRNAAGLNYLIDHPNTREDVSNYLVNNTQNNVSTEENSMPNGFGNTAMVNEPISAFPNSSMNNNQVNSNINNQSYSNVQTSTNNTLINKNSKRKIIGIQSLTPHAGATTLMYMMVKQLNNNYKAKGIEMQMQDSIYFRDDNLSVCTSFEDLKYKIKTFNDADVIVIDLNGLDPNGICDETLLLLEPGTIRLNKLIKKDPSIFEKIRNHKLILNRSSIKDDEINNFEYETKLKVFYNMTNFNERKERIQIVDLLLIKLGFSKQSVSGGLFGLFK